MPLLLLLTWQRLIVIFHNLRTRRNQQFCLIAVLLLSQLCTFALVASNLLSSLGFRQQEDSDETSGRKCAILYLANQRRIEELAYSLQLLFENFNCQFRYPVIIFYDEDNKTRFDKSGLLQNLQLETHEKSLISFELVRFKIPEGLKKSKVAVWSHRFPNYQHMIAFWAYHVFHHPRVRKLEYYLRLDSDSLLLEPVTTDLFSVAKDTRCLYGYIELHLDPAEVVKGMALFVKQYVASRKVRPAQPNKLKTVLNATKRLVPMPLYYNNFELLHIPTFRQQQFEEFRRAFFDSGRIYTHRWGDAPQRYVMANLFLKASEVQQVCACSYKHQNLKVLATC